MRIIILFDWNYLLRNIGIIFGVMLMGCIATEKFKVDEKVNQIYQLDEKVRLKEKELLATRQMASEAMRENKFEITHELRQKSTKLEQELNELDNSLKNLIEEYEQSWLKQAWWHKIALETGVDYIYFDNNLDIDDTYGIRFKIHWLKQEFQRFHPASYLYYPTERREDYPLRIIETSSFIMGYRQAHTMNNKTNKGGVKINSYLTGFGFLGQTWKNTYIKLNLSIGLQRYTKTDPNDTGLLVGYTLGIYQKISNTYSLGLEINPEIVFTNANQDQITPTFNFSTALICRFSF